VQDLVSGRGQVFERLIYEGKLEPDLTRPNARMLQPLDSLGKAFSPRTFVADAQIDKIIALSFRAESWIGKSPDARIFRRDDGSLLLRGQADGTLSPVLPPKPDRGPELQLSTHDVADPGDGKERDPLGHLTLTVADGAKAGRAYWLRVEAVDPPPGLVVLPPPTHLRLEPGQSVDLQVDLSWMSPSDPPVPRLQAPLRLKVVHAFGESQPIELLLNLRAPVIEWVGEPLVDTDAVRFTLENRGQQATGPILVDATYGERDQYKADDGHLMIGARESHEDLAPGETWTFSVRIPGPAKRRGRFSVDLKVSTNLGASWVRFPPRTWTQRQYDLRVGFSLLVYAAAGLAALLLAAGFAYARIFRHPIVVRAASPGTLTSVPLAALPAADRALPPGLR
jgi:hypothetical protein